MQDSGAAETNMFFLCGVPAVQQLQTVLLTVVECHLTGMPSMTPVQLQNCMRKHHSKMSTFIAQGESVKTNHYHLKVMAPSLRSLGR